MIVSWRNVSMLLVLASLGLSAGCGRASAPEGTRSSAAAPPATAPDPAPGVTATAPGMAGGLRGSQMPTARGKVVETLVTAGYTYVRVQPDSGKEFWGASTEFPVNVGDEVLVSTAMPMVDYESATLHRKFELVYFADGIEVVGKDAGSVGHDAGALGHDAGAADAAAIASAHAGLATPPPKAVDLAGIEKAPDGLTVAEVNGQAASLSGKTVTFRGKVVKYTPGVLGKNWLHVRDGSGDGGEADVTVTTGDTAAIGDLVLVKGTVATNQDLGSGYSYAVLIQDAKLEVQR